MCRPAPPLRVPDPRSPLRPIAAAFGPPARRRKRGRGRSFFRRRHAIGLRRERGSARDECSPVDSLLPLDMVSERWSDAKTGARRAADAVGPRVRHPLREVRRVACPRRSQFPLVQRSPRPRSHHRRAGVARDGAIWDGTAWRAAPSAGRPGACRCLRPDRAASVVAQTRMSSHTGLDAASRGGVARRSWMSPGPLAPAKAGSDHSATVADLPAPITLPSSLTPPQVREGGGRGPRARPCARGRAPY